MIRLTVLLVFGAMLLPTICALADTAPARQQAQSFQKEIKVTVKCNYLLYLPKDYDANKDQGWPPVRVLWSRTGGVTIY